MNSACHAPVDARGHTPRSAPHLEEERLTIGATQRQFGTILQHHEMIAMEQRLYFGNGAFAHHNRAAYSNELLRAELGYHTLDMKAVSGSARLLQSLERRPVRAFGYPGIRDRAPRT